MLQTQYILVAQIIQSSSLGSLKIDPWFVPQGSIHDDPLQVVVRLKTNHGLGLRQVLHAEFVAGTLKTSI